MVKEKRNLLFEYWTLISELDLEPEIEDFHSQDTLEEAIKIMEAKRDSALQTQEDKETS